MDKKEEEVPTKIIDEYETMNEKEEETPKKMMVWWDLDTCPVPRGFDPRHVRACIESALKKKFGNVPVTIHAMGNLDLVSTIFLRALSSSGIFLKHGPFGPTELVSPFADWRDSTPAPAVIMTISAEPLWHNNNMLQYGYSLVGAIPKSVKPGTMLSDTEIQMEWSWETLLKEHQPTETSWHDFKKTTDEPAWLCRLCEYPAKNFRDFVSHLQSDDHKHKWRNSVAQNMAENKPVWLCEQCNYPAHNSQTLTWHSNTYHQQKAEPSRKKRRTRRGWSQQEPSSSRRRRVHGPC